MGALLLCAVGENCRTPRDDGYVPYQGLPWTPGASERAVARQGQLNRARNGTGEAFGVAYPSGSHHPGRHRVGVLRGDRGVEVCRSIRGGGVEHICMRGLYHYTVSIRAKTLEPVLING